MEKIPNLLLIAVPRHPEAFDQMTSLCHQYDFNYLNRSDNRPPSGDEQVFIGDSMGELTMMCGTSNIAFVGGSLIDRGGHNPLEPAVCGNAVIMGDSFYNFSDVCRIMKQYEVIDIIKNQSELETCILSLLSNKKLLEERAKNISNLFARNSGASTKLSLMIKELVIKTETI